MVFNIILFCSLVCTFLGGGDEIICMYCVLCILYTISELLYTRVISVTGNEKYRWGGNE